MEGNKSKKILELIDSLNNSKSNSETLLRLKIGLSDYINAYHLTAFIKNDRGFNSLVSTMPDFHQTLFNFEDTWSELLLYDVLDLNLADNELALAEPYSNKQHNKVRTLLISSKMNEVQGFFVCYYFSDKPLENNKLTLVKSLQPIFRQAFDKLDQYFTSTRIIKERTAALTMSQARFQAYAELASDWFWETDAQLKYEYISTSEHKFAAKPYSHFIGKTPLEVRTLNEQAQQKKWGMFVNFINQRSDIHNFEYEAKTKEGKSCWISISGKAQFDINGNYIGYMGIGKDISYTKQRELDLQREKEKAESANAAKSDFLAVMSHEIRTPMNAILGMLELLEDTKPDGKQQELIDYMRASTQLLQGVISDTLDFAKIESGTLKLELSDTNIINLTKNLVKQFETQALKNKILFEFEIDSSIPKTLVCDGVRLSQILLNLLGNAFKFTQKGSVKLFLNRSDNQIIFRVIDTGIGISEGDITKLFEPFTQFHNRQKGRQQGVGLGLSITRRLLNLMGGSINCYSEVGKGTEFIVRIPFEKATEKNSQCTINDDTKNNLQQLRVLVAEDNIANQFVIKAILEKRNYKVTIVNHGKEAISALQERTFDLVLMDMMMPVMDGVTASSYIRNDLLYSDIPIIALTANAGLDDKERCLEAGMNDVLTKPLDSKLLDLKIKEHLTQ